MPKFSLIKIIDEAILPSVVAGSAKIGGIFIAQIYSRSSVFTDSARFVNSISDSLLLLALIAGFGWVIIKAHHFHLSHIHPARHAKLTKQGLSHFVQDSYEIYHQALVWLVLLWFSLCLILIENWQGEVYFWVALAAGLVSIGLTYLLWEDVRFERSLAEDVNDGKDQ